MLNVWCHVSGRTHSIPSAAADVARFSPEQRKLQTFLSHCSCTACSQLGICEPCWSLNNTCSQCGNVFCKTCLEDFLVPECGDLSRHICRDCGQECVWCGFRGMQLNGASVCQWCSRYVTDLCYKGAVHQLADITGINVNVVKLVLSYVRVQSCYIV